MRDPQGGCLQFGPAIVLQMLESLLQLNPATNPGGQVLGIPGLERCVESTSETLSIR